jgi:hypothetical protein
MRLPVFTTQDIDTLKLALASLSSKVDPRSLAPLSDKLSRYETASMTNQDAHIVLNTTIKDIAFSDDPSGESILNNNKCSYSFNIEASTHTDTYYFSVYNESLDKVAGDASLTGLFGAIEIREGKPCISIGMSPDENDIHIISNNSTQLTVVPEKESGERYWEQVEFQNHSTKCLNFTIDTAHTLNEQRSFLAACAFGEYDFGDLIVSDDSSWDIDGTQWTKTVFFEDDDKPSIKGTFSLSFVPDSSYINSCSYTL